MGRRLRAKSSTKAENLIFWDELHWAAMHLVVEHHEWLGLQPGPSIRGV